MSKPSIRILPHRARWFLLVAALPAFTLAAGAPARAAVSMTDVSSGGLTGGGGQGASWVDYDGDGDLDLFFGVTLGKNHLMRNNGGLSFTDVAPAVVQDSTGDIRSMAWGDYDGDGDPDLYLCNYPSEPNKLLRNDGGVFTNVTPPALSIVDYCKGAYWIDFDNDGDLDLSVVSRGANRLFRNDGGGAFTDVSSVYPALPWTIEGAAWGDFDNDGDLDLYVGRDGLANVLLVNDGQGGFTSSSIASIQDTGYARGVTWGDFNNDGYLDLYVGNYSGPDRLFESLGGADFADVSATLLPPGTSDGNVASFVDVDGDGRLDVMVDDRTSTRILVNNYPGAFTAVTVTSNQGAAGGAAWGDADGDGDPDLYIARLGAGQLLRNDSDPGNHWLALHLTGRNSNRGSVGARAVVYTPAGMQLREWASSSGWQSQNAPDLLFGLGTASMVDSVRITWPSGNFRVLHDVDADRALSLTEPAFTASDSLPETYVELAWSAETTPGFYTIVSRDEDPGDLTPPTVLTWAAGMDSTFADYTAVPGAVYLYEVDTYSLPDSQLVKVRRDYGSRKFRAPTGFTASQGSDPDGVDLFWLDNSDIETGYRISRSATSQFITSGQAEKIQAPPSVAIGALASDDSIRVFREVAAYQDPYALSVDVADPGTWAGNASDPGTVPAGSIITSYFVHGDRVSSGYPGVTYSGSIRFDRPILGVLVEDTSLDNTDFLGSSTGLGTTSGYTTGRSARGLEQLDTFTISEDRLTFSFTFNIHGVGDEVRIITEGGSTIADLAANQSGYFDGSALPDTVYDYTLVPVTTFDAGGERWRSPAPRSTPRAGAARSSRP